MAKINIKSEKLTLLVEYFYFPLFHHFPAYTQIIVKCAICNEINNSAIYLIILMKLTIR